jgi:hypothetical protein
MAKEYKGRHFRALKREDLQASTPLRCDLFLFLPLNNRMFRLRSREQEVDSETLQGYLRAGENLFILDPERHQGSYDFESDEAPWNPRLPEDLMARFRSSGKPVEAAEATDPVQAGKEAAKLLEEPQQEALPAEDPVFEGVENKLDLSGSLIRKAGSTASEEAVATVLASDTPEAAERDAPLSPNAETDQSSDEHSASVRIKPLPEEKVSGKKIDTSELPLEEETAIGTGEAIPEDAVRVSDSSEKEKVISFSADSNSEESVAVSAAASTEPEQRFGADPKAEDGEELEIDRRAEEGAKDFSADAESPHEQKIRAEEALKEEGICFSSELGSEEETRKISGEVAAMEDAMAVATAAGKEFVDELRRIEAGEADGDSEWVLASEGGSGEVSPENAAAGRFSRAISKQLGKLRSELNQSIQHIPDGMSREEVQERRQALKKEIDRLEGVSLLLEALDDEDLEVSHLPDELKDLDKHGLLGHLENAMAGLKGGKLLSEKDHKLLSRKVNKAKEEELSGYGEEISNLKDRFAAPLLRARDQNVPLEAAEREKLNLSLAKEVETAQTGMRIAKALTGLRGSLSELLEAKPKSAKERQANEAKASELMQSIRKLENLATSVEAGEEVNPAELAPFRRPVGLGFSVKEGESPGESLERISASLDQLRKEVISSKSEAAAAEKRLMGKVFEEARESEERDKQGEVLELVSQMREGLRREQEKLLEVLKRAPAGEDHDAEARALETYKTVCKMQEVLREADSGMEVADLKARWGMLAELPPPRKRETRPADAEALKENRRQAENLARESKRVSIAIAGSDFDSLKRLSVDTSAIDQSKKSLSRQLQAYTETGKDPDPKDVWGLNREVTRSVREATVRIGLATEIGNLGLELERLRRLEPTNEEDRKQIEAEIRRIEGEMLGLHRMSEALVKGEPVDPSALARFEKEVPPLFIFTKDKPVQEEVQRISAALEDVKEELLSVQAGAMGVLADILFKAEDIGTELEKSLIRDHEAEERAAEAAFRTMVEDSEQKKLQLGVLAATFFRAFGYNRTELEQDLLLACCLWDEPESSIADFFSDRVAAFHQAARGAMVFPEMLLRDTGQAARLAREYIRVAQVTSGKYSLDPNAFSKFCVKLRTEMEFEADGELLERAEQFARRGFLIGEREELVEAAKRATRQFTRWKSKAG